MTDQRQTEMIIDRDSATATSEGEFVKRTNEKLIFQRNIIIDFTLIAFIVRTAERYLYSFASKSSVSYLRCGMRKFQTGEADEKADRRLVGNLFPLDLKI